MACRSDEPRLDQLRRQGIVVEKIDVDQHPDLAGQFGVVAIPAYFLMDETTGTWKRISIR